MVTTAILIFVGVKTIKGNPTDAILCQPEVLKTQKRRTCHSVPVRICHSVHVRWKSHNRNQEVGTSRDSSWQLRCNGGRLTATVTKACKFFCVMTRQASPLFPAKLSGAISEYLQNRRALKKQSSKFWPVSITTPVNASRKRRKKRPTDCLTASCPAISPPANLFHSSHLFSPLLFHCSSGFSGWILFFFPSASLPFFYSLWTPPFLLLTLSFNSFLNATLFSFFSSQPLSRSIPDSTFTFLKHSYRISLYHSQGIQRPRPPHCDGGMH